MLRKGLKIQPNLQRLIALVDGPLRRPLEPIRKAFSDTTSFYVVELGLKIDIAINRT